MANLGILLFFIDWSLCEGPDSVNANLYIFDKLLFTVLSYYQTAKTELFGIYR